MPHYISTFVAFNYVGCGCLDDFVVAGNTLKVLFDFLNGVNLADRLCVIRLVCLWIFLQIFKGGILNWSDDGVYGS